MANNDIISDELLAAFLEGNTSKEETLQVLQALKTDNGLQEVLGIAAQTNDEKWDNTKEYELSRVSNISKPIKKLGLGTTKRKNK